MQSNKYNEMKSMYCPTCMRETVNWHYNNSNVLSLPLEWLSNISENLKRSIRFPECLVRRLNTRGRPKINQPAG